MSHPPMDMHHPGPPQFVATGHRVELAPRDPDPEETYTWELTQLPDNANVVLGDDSVEHFVPDVPGTYVATLTAPDGIHQLTIRVFPGELSPQQQGFQSGVSAGRSGGAVFDIAHSGDASRRDDESLEHPGEGGRPRLTLDPNIVEDAVVISAVPQPHPHGMESGEDLTVEYLFDDRDEFDPNSVRTQDNELRIPLDSIPDRLRVHAVAVGTNGYSVPDAVEIDGNQETVTRLYEPPAWAENAFIYEIYVRTFTESAEDRSAFDKITDRLAYLANLGVDVIWLTPVLENDHAPHGYNITDFFSIASDLGDRDDYERFVDAAHDYGMKVLFDIVCNHSARTHPYFQEAVSNPESEYRDWYEWRSETQPETYFDWEHIANFNFDHLPVRRHLLDVVDAWAPLVDGFRCDMAWAVPNGFWRELHDRVKAQDRSFLLLDETIPYIPDFQAGLFDMHFDSTTYFHLRQIAQGHDATQLIKAIENRTEIGFPDHAAFMVYAENHDETRYIVEGGPDAAMAALGAIFTLPGAPMVYAGQESGERSKRDSLAWEETNEQFQEQVAQFSRLRATHPALRADAAFSEVGYTVHDGEPSQVVSYRRDADSEAIITVLNFGATPATVELDDGVDPIDLATGEHVGEESTITVEQVAIMAIN